MAHSLPVRLRYLEPVRKHLAALNSDAIDEDTDLSVLRRAVRRRLKGLSDEEARSALQEDAAVLTNWLSTPGLPDERLIFVLPILPDAIEILLADPPQEPPERGEVSMDLPDGADVKKEHGCLSVKWRRFSLFVYPQHCEEMHGFMGQYHGDAKSMPMHAGKGISVTEVRFGEVLGVSVSSFACKRVNYALEAPGGYVLVVLDSSNRNFDESQLEAYFHTLRILNYRPSPWSNSGQPSSSASND